MSDLKKITMEISELFEFNEFLEESYECDIFSDLKYECYIESPDGIVPIRQLVKKTPEDWVEVTLENGIEVVVSLNHRFVINGNIIYAKDLKVGDYLETVEGLVKIKHLNIKENTDEFLYGLSLDAPHLYYDANGILHHNTALKIATAAGMSLQKKNGLYVSLEMEEAEILKRFDANLLYTQLHEFDNMSWEVYKAKYDKVKDYTGKFFVKEYPAGGFSVFDLQFLKDEIENEHNIKLDYIVVDYLNLMKSTRAKLSQGSYTYFKSIAEELHGFAKQNDIIIISSSQMNRSSYNNTEAGMENISESIGVIATADFAASMLSNEELRQQKQIILKADKNRYTGKLEKVLLEVDFSRMAFKGIVDEQAGIKQMNQKVNEVDNNNLPDLTSQLNASFGVPEDSAGDLKFEESSGDFDFGDFE